MSRFDEINTVGVSRDEATAVALRAERTRDFAPTIGEVAVGLSSGTSGSRGLFLTTRRERARWVAAIVERVLGFSLRPRRVAFFLRANNALYEAAGSRLIAFDFYDLARPLPQLTEELLAATPDVLIAQPSVLRHLGRAYAERPGARRPARVVSVAEVLERDVAAALSADFGCRIEQVYQATEGFLAHTCSAGRLHLNDDWLVVERRAVGPGRFHPVITDLWRRSQPLVRYELNDILRADDRRCPCGLASTVIAAVEGRADDVFEFPAEGVTLFPDFLRRAVLTASDGVAEFEVVRTGEGSVSVYVEPAPGCESEEVYGEAAAGLHDLFARHGLHLSITRHRRPSQGPGAKFKRIRNDYATPV